MTKVEETQEFHYHVVYGFNDGNKSGYGSLRISFKQPIQYQSDVTIAKKGIEKEYGYDNVVVLSWIPLKGLERSKNTLD